MKSEIGYHGGQRHERHTRRASRLFFFAFLIFVFRPLPIARLQDHPLGELLRILRRVGMLFVSLREQTRARRTASWPSLFGDYRLTCPAIALIA